MRLTRRNAAVILSRRSGGLGAYGPANTTPRPDYSAMQPEAVAVQIAPPPPPATVVLPTPPPSSGAVYMPQAPWQVRPPDAEPFDFQGYQAIAAAVSTTAILTFTVPLGRDGVIHLFGNQAFGAGWTQGTTDLVWQILRNGAVIQNYENILASLGNMANPVEIGLRVFENDVILVQAINNAVVGNPIVGARCNGWFYPKAHNQDGWRD